MDPAEYKKLYLEGKIPQTDYDDCRFAKDKYQYAKDWLLKRQNCNIDDPQTIVDVICKQKLDIITAPYNEVLQKRLWADKIAAMSMLNSIDAADICIPPLQLNNGNYAEETNCVTPELFSNINVPSIVKTNHGSGWNYKLIPGKTNLQLMCNTLNVWLHLNYAYISGYERQYEDIIPGILAQPILTDYPVDWSFWCVDGKIEGVSLTKKLGKNLEDYIAFVDADGKQNPWYIGTKPQMKNLNPKQVEILKRMIPYVNKLSAGEKFVRVDLYCIGDKIYFGEKTYTPCSGVLDITYT